MPCRVVDEVSKTTVVPSRQNDASQTARENTVVYCAPLGSRLIYGSEFAVLLATPAAQSVFRSRAWCRKNHFKKETSDVRDDRSRVRKREGRGVQACVSVTVCSIRRPVYRHNTVVCAERVRGGVSSIEAQPQLRAPHSHSVQAHTQNTTGRSRAALRTQRAARALLQATHTKHTHPTLGIQP